MNTDFIYKQIDALARLCPDDDFKVIRDINRIFVKKYIDIFDLKSRKDRKKILSVEVGAGHDVIRPSIYKYFTELGYEVDFLLYGNNPEDRWNFFRNVENPQYRELVGNEAFILSILSLPIISEYDYVFFNSNFVYNQGRFDSNWDYKTFLNKMHIPDNCKHGYLTIPPHPVYYSNNDRNIQFFTHLGVNNTPMLSVSYFGNVNITPKSDKNIFLMTGNINTGQKNHTMILDAVRQVIESGTKNFELWINGCAVKEFVVPKNLSHYVKYLGENRPETLFSIIEQADFIISGIDSKQEWQRSVYSTGTCSVGLMYSLGFGKIYICEDIFAKAFGLNDDNALIYEQGNLVNTLKKAINLSNDDYTVLQKHLLKEAQNREKKSLEDIKFVLKNLKSKYKKRANRCSIHSFSNWLKFIKAKILYTLRPKKRSHYEKKLREFDF